MEVQVRRAWVSAPTFLPDSRKDPLYFALFPLHVRMHIAFQGDIGVGVAQDFTESLDVAAALQACGGKGMPQGVRMHPAHPGPAQIPPDALAVAARFHWPLCTA